MNTYAGGGAPTSGNFATRHLGELGQEISPPRRFGSLAVIFLISGVKRYCNQVKENRERKAARSSDSEPN
jgi:hypothetical protein